MAPQEDRQHGFNMANAKASVAHPSAVNAELERAAFRDFPHGLVLLDAGGQVVTHNSAAESLLEGLASDDRQERNCCSLFGCGAEGTGLAGRCLTDAALNEQDALPETRLDVSTPEGPKVLWLSAGRLASSEHVVVQVRLGPDWDRRRRANPDWMTGPRLRIYALGNTVVELGDKVIGGQWLDQRTGQLLKYLVVERHRAVYVDEIGESLWPDAGYGVAKSVRYYIHALRRTLEPGRRKREPSRFIASSGARYRLNLEHVEVDVDQFEAHTSHGLALVESDPAGAAEELERGVALYRGELVADAPYAEWAIPERHRLHELACAGLRNLATLRMQRGALNAATRCVERLAVMQPYDEAVHRQLMELKISAGRRSDAMRHYGMLRTRIKRAFGHEPRFKPSDLALFPDRESVSSG